MGADHAQRKRDNSKIAWGEGIMMRQYNILRIKNVQHRRAREGDTIFCTIVFNFLLLLINQDNPYRYMIHQLYLDMCILLLPAVLCCRGNIGGVF